VTNTLPAESDVVIFFTNAEGATTTGESLPEESLEHENNNVIKTTSTKADFFIFIFYINKVNKKHLTLFFAQKNSIVF
jgi:hypothetical protein